MNRKIKKIFMFSLILFATMGMVFSQSLNVASPSGGTWYKGSNHNITWTSSGCSSPNVKINIFKNSIAVDNFIEQLTGPNTGTKNWTVPMGYANGTYYIRIKTDPAEAGCIGDSAAFQITDTPATGGSITIAHPALNEEFYKGKTETINWTSSGCSSPNVKINIFKNSIAVDNFIEQLTGPNTGTKNWTVPMGYTNGTYIIRIKTDPAETGCIGDSRTFFILDKPFTTGSIRVISPTSMWSFTAGGNMTTKWSTSGITGNVRLRLKNTENAWSLIIKNTHPYDSSPLSWSIPDNVVQGKYFITIDQGEVTGRSGNFTINQKTSLINVTRPLGGVTKLKGEICSISWFSSNVNSNKVSIFLRHQRPGAHIQVTSYTVGTADNKPGRNIYSWRIPEIMYSGTISNKIPDGRYTISVEKPDGSIKGESREFNIAGSRGCDLAITAAEFCSGKLSVTIRNNGDHYTGDIVVIMIYDQFGKTKVSVPVIQKKSFILFAGKTTTLNETNNFLRSAVLGCQMNYILKLIPDKNHNDTNGANNQYNGVAYKDCNVRNCDKPDLWFEKVWVKKKYRNSAFQAGDKVKVLANLIQLGRVNKNFTTSLVIYYHKEQFDPWTRVTDRRWFFVDIGRKKELDFTFTPAERGYYVFEWVTDMHEDVDERDERNNKKIGREFIWEKR